MRRLILIAAAALALPVAAQVTAPDVGPATAGTAENHSGSADVDAGTTANDVSATAAKPAKAKAKHKPRTTDSAATSDRPPVDNSNYLPTTQNPY
ncbi:MAG TPA: hypothetical protein VK533_01205 [Sphingomonas sp.]|uniref:hypothetical protein n=1 Tax=Sphingomonas sp. TaxID=28214 RepID=UPI002C007809|nr:hypothetical protein [Sphingomonas sp.]HMI18138.1 hypothetical protein [Sphingomonas sp.]